MEDILLNQAAEQGFIVLILVVIIISLCWVIIKGVKHYTKLIENKDKENKELQEKRLEDISKNLDIIYKVNIQYDNYIRTISDEVGDTLSQKLNDNNIKLVREIEVLIERYERLKKST